MKIAQILVAAGSGARFGGEKPKQYHDLKGRPLILQTLEPFCDPSLGISHHVIVAAKNDPFIADAIREANVEPMIVTGGTTRSASVRAGLMALSDIEPDIVLIHDAARPLVGLNLIQSVIDGLKSHQAVAPVLPIVDAVKSYERRTIGGDIDRSALRRVQTPQGFRYKDIFLAYKNLAEDAAFPDDIAVAHEVGLDIGHVDGHEDNFKVTFANDLIKAERVLSDKSYMATGHGYDVHRTEPGDHLWLCGVKIDAGFSLKGHSDADVGLHAITDAIFGALAEGDIGDHFPPTDPKWAGADSSQFLQFAADRVQARKGRLQHVDVTLICEKPKVKPHRDAMRNRIAEILSLSIARVSVKATTTEKLGFAGRGEGLAAQATATIQLPD